ncbi:phytanoyl-CoA dioxygenase family protein [Puniceicoccus vermicola]|uniref:Phytanoyl-CoA dioxygenase family protein n=1 Tax=Puniceicoccus vermicola TaxID=388746 RepID=A0A7X1AXC1_9BACT|nr:phytanoyl-CoA dioxygenase family protein [Puniceicoccus vermicola]MBC2601721.1 phytanoyl-CoA dioxygenase family protein [Puniceicoccus vermicola]
MTKIQANPDKAKQNRLVTPEQVEQFHRDGWCVVDSLFSTGEIDTIEHFFEDFKNNGLAAYDSGDKFEDIDPKKRQLRAMHPHRYSEKAKAWGLHPKVIEVLKVLFGKPPLMAQTMYYFKPPGARGQGMHQDNFYLLAAPSTCIAAWTAIDEANVDNGCLWGVPESHSREIICPKGIPDTSWMNYGDSHVRPFPRSAKPIPIPAPRGSTMFFNGQFIHGSSRNRTKDRSRRSFIGHYVDANTESLSVHYHPIHDENGNVMSRIAKTEGGGPCGDGVGGGIH